MNSKVDDYIKNLEKWQKEIKLLRKIALECNLIEDYKWMHPCYTFQKKNIVLLQDFKNYCALGFVKGALLSDSHKVLVKITENVQAARQIRFTNLTEIANQKPIIKQYIFEAIEIEKAGLEVAMKKATDFEVPKELTEAFKEDVTLKNAFNNLTPGRQRGYLLHFSKPKQAKTRTARIKSCTNRILNGKGLNDCVCGLSKRMPNCDGSHKQLNS